MARIKSIDTTPEIKLRKAIWKLGIRGYRIHLNSLIGKPDLVFTKKKVAIFVDGDFWHGYNWKNKGIIPKRGYWQKKITRNIERREVVKAQLKQKGWKVVELWEHDIKKDAMSQAKKIKCIINP
ncbi:MAG: DNA mismatch endonuclease Vsr [Candidatus Parvarchaeum acidiphilum ARMAN-4]|uniref:DNA mismatch endonuclease Vsr n=1 Tax=Candidatus Parvarchaeum acidiphilum ARMAN-4 TaxID=662760 RepID=D2EGA7_PARA4|nr:very short patch repair protein [Candidatus Parvarchaeum acidiphilum ARMAN-4]EEZ92610.1 MAG: DNA mismatch endonuclease Vsr [Candidatus Parvarchaeum acidiphilum ARMAN-4]